MLAVPTTHPLAKSRKRLHLADIAGEQLLLLEDGHCLRDQALSVCHLAGAGERVGFRATSLETLRQMVAAGVGATLLPHLSVSDPIPQYHGVRLQRFADPAPMRRIGMVWRTTSPQAQFFADIAAVIRTAAEAIGLTVAR